MGDWIVPLWGLHFIVCLLGFMYAKGWDDFDDKPKDEMSWWFVLAFVLGPTLWATLALAVVVMLAFGVAYGLFWTWWNGPIAPRRRLAQ